MCIIGGGFLALPFMDLAPLKGQDVGTSEGSLLFKDKDRLFVIHNGKKGEVELPPSITGVVRYFYAGPDSLLIEGFMGKGRRKNHAL